MALAVFLAPACTSIGARAFNVREMHEDDGHHRLVAVQMDDTEYLFQKGFLALLKKDPSIASSKAPAQLENPLETCVENLLAVVGLKRACREAGVEKLEAGPKGMVLSFRGNAFSNPAGLIAWLSTRGGLVRLRPDHKLSIVREMDLVTRLTTAREILGNLARLAVLAKAA